jgi:hypothetical protein
MKPEVRKVMTIMLLLQRLFLLLTTTSFYRKKLHQIFNKLEKCKLLKQFLFYWKSLEIV